MVQLPTEFRASLDDYRGPLDLLLYLIKKEELDILEIPISRITQQYLSYLQTPRAIDPNLCGEVVVLAAQLMEIKSRTLLPIDTAVDAEEELDDPRLELVLQLLEYKKYKERALFLEKLAQEHARKHARPEQDLAQLSGDEPAIPLKLGSVSIWDLLTAFQRVQLALSLRQPHRVLFEDRPIEDFMRAIETRLVEASEAAAGLDDDARRTAARVPFEDFFAACRNRFDAISYLLALLELARLGVLCFHQEETFGPILVAPAPPKSEPDAATAEEPPAGVAPERGGESE
jgi:segregation and condensation protein A